MINTNLAFLNILLEKLPTVVCRFKEDPKNQNYIHKLDYTKSKITTYIENLVLQSPNHLSDDTKKLKQKWEKFSEKFIDEAEFSPKMFDKSKKLISLLRNICPNEFTLTVDNLTKPNNDNLYNVMQDLLKYDMMQYLLNKQTVHYEFDNILENQQASSDLPEKVEFEQMQEVAVEQEVQVEQEAEFEQVVEMPQTGHILGFTGTLWNQPIYSSHFESNAENHYEAP